MRASRHSYRNLNPACSLPAATPASGLAPLLLLRRLRQRWLSSRASASGCRGGSRGSGSRARCASTPRDRDRNRACRSRRAQTTRRSRSFWMKPRNRLRSKNSGALSSCSSDSRCAVSQHRFSSSPDESVRGRSSRAARARCSNARSPAGDCAQATRRRNAASLCPGPRAITRPSASASSTPRAMKNDRSSPGCAARILLRSTAGTARPG